VNTHLGILSQILEKEGKGRSFPATEKKSQNSACVIGFLEMNGSNGEERVVHEVAMVVPKRVLEEEEGDCVEVLVTELRKKGMVVDRVVGLAHEFLKVGLSLPNLLVIL